MTNGGEDYEGESDGEGDADEDSIDAGAVRRRRFSTVLRRKGLDAVARERTKNPRVGSGNGNALSFEQSWFFAINA